MSYDHILLSNHIEAKLIPNAHPRKFCYKEPAKSECSDYDNIDWSIEKLLIMLDTANYIKLPKR